MDWQLDHYLFSCVCSLRLSARCSVGKSSDIQRISKQTRKEILPMVRFLNNLKTDLSKDSATSFKNSRKRNKQKGGKNKDSRVIRIWNWFLHLKWYVLRLNPPIPFSTCNILATAGFFIRVTWKGKRLQSKQYAHKTQERNPTYNWKVHLKLVPQASYTKA